MNRLALSSHSHSHSRTTDSPKHSRPTQFGDRKYKLGLNYTTGRLDVARFHEGKETVLKLPNPL